VRRRVSALKLYCDTVHRPGAWFQIAGKLPHIRAARAHQSGRVCTVPAARSDTFCDISRPVGRGIHDGDLSQTPSTTVSLFPTQARLTPTATV
jgi:hypothetical protein